MAQDNTTAHLTSSYSYIFPDDGENAFFYGHHANLNNNSQMDFYQTTTKQQSIVLHGYNFTLPKYSVITGIKVNIQGASCAVGEVASTRFSSSVSVGVAPIEFIPQIKDRGGFYSDNSEVSTNPPIYYDSLPILLDNIVSFEQMDDAPYFYDTSVGKEDTPFGVDWNPRHKDYQLRLKIGNWESHYNRLHRVHPVIYYRQYDYDEIPEPLKLKVQEFKTSGKIHIK